MSELTDKLRERLKFDTGAAHRVICDIAEGKHRWEMCIPVQQTDSDMILQTPLDYIDRLAPLHELLLETVETLDALARRHSWQPNLGACILKAIEITDKLRSEVEK